MFKRFQSFISELRVRRMVRRHIAAQQDAVMFQKEARYSARRVRSRLAATREVNDLQAFGTPSFLRRKTVQGKGETPKK
jgi:Ca-activated chloride channel homolog